MAASYVALRADHVLHGSYTIDIYSDDVSSCTFVQNRTIGDEVKGIR